ncbi:DEAD/DEAH box helicase, partial [Helicosporidium sp. ATCC 50920]
LEFAEEGWQAVEVDDAALLGDSGEFGFAGLEVFHPKKQGVPVVEAEPRARGTKRQKDAPAAAAEGGAGEEKRPSKAAKKRAGKKSAVVEKVDEELGDEELGSMEALRAQVRALRAENLKLKGSSADSGKGKGAEPKQKQKVKRVAASASKKKAALDEPTAEPPAPPTPGVNMDSWRIYGLSEPVLSALGALGFEEPTPIQAAVVEAAVRDGRDVLGAAQTGSGKTLAFGLPIIERLLRERRLEAREEGGAAPARRRCLKALIVAPTRELALQVQQHLERVARPCGLRVVPVVGGLAIQKQERQLVKRPEIVVGTPGRLWEVMQASGPAASHLCSLGGLRALVIDEADSMVMPGRFVELKSIVDRPLVVDLTPERQVASGVAEASLQCTEESRDVQLYCLLQQHPGRTLVFVNAIAAARRLTAILKILGLPVQALHAEQQQRQRLKALDRFRDSEQAVLVATDVAARGLDIPGVACVVHYQLPATLDSYVHRSGRTARAEKEGLAVAMVMPKEAARYQALLRALNKAEAPPPFPLDPGVYLEAKRRVSLALRVDALERGAAKQHADRAWRRTQARDMDLLLSEDEDYQVALAKVELSERPGRTEEERRADQALSLRAQLAQHLAQPLQRRYSGKYLSGGAVAALGEAGSAGELVRKAVHLAQEAVDARRASEKAAEDKLRKKGGNPAQKKPARSRAQVVQMALERELRRRAAKKQGRGGLTTVNPQALGRATHGPGALEALRASLKA